MASMAFDLSVSKKALILASVAILPSILPAALPASIADRMLLLVDKKRSPTVLAAPFLIRP